MKQLDLRIDHLKNTYVLIIYFKFHNNTYIRSPDIKRTIIYGLTKRYNLISTIHKFCKILVSFKS